jgi:hypothetical protein
MHHDEAANVVEQLAFKFFLRFSRFEFALKETGYLKNHTEGRPAEPGWAQFEQNFKDGYVLENAGARLLELAPQRQVVAAHSRLKFVPETFAENVSELGKVTRLLKNVRNNLFHGGKHKPDGWDDPERVFELLSVGLAILDDLANQSGIEADYLGRY